MPLYTYSDPQWRGLKLVTHWPPPSDRSGRILAALGAEGGRSPLVDDRTLYRYYVYLAQNLSFPFFACYPPAAEPAEETQHRHTVVELLDPQKHLSDDFSGIFCKTRRGRFEANLPLVELDVPQDSPNLQVIEDYCHWFWTWR